jgi:beta-N-acetylhexosaminidase
MRAIVENEDAHILIDQEGGRVQRLTEPNWPKYPPGRTFGKEYEFNPEQAKSSCAQNYAAIARDLKTLGIDVNCVPVLDVPVLGSHDVIGDRAFSTDPVVVAQLGQIAAEALLAEGVIPIMKHIPGHGRATVDSHLELPRVTETLAKLEHDIKPFQMCSHLPWAMTAHVLYTAIDEKNPATLSKKVIQDCIRGQIGFHGVLLSDDLGMKALKGNFGELAVKSIDAGCDLTLHCSGDMKEMQEIADKLKTPLGEKSLVRLDKANQKARINFAARKVG